MKTNDNNPEPTIPDISKPSADHAGDQAGVFADLPDRNYDGDDGTYCPAAPPQTIAEAANTPEKAEKLVDAFCASPASGETPRTDSARCYQRSYDPQWKEIVPANFARQLECELESVRSVGNDTQMRLRKAGRELAEATNTASVRSDEADGLAGQLAEARAQLRDMTDQFFKVSGELADTANSLTEWIETAQRRADKLAEVRKANDVWTQSQQAEIARLDEQVEQGQNELAELRGLLAASQRQVSTIEDFLWGRKYCTELYISPLGFFGCESWQVELNYGDSTEAFQGDSVADALSKAMVAAMVRAKLANDKETT